MIRYHRRNVPRVTLALVLFLVFVLIAEYQVTNHPHQWLESLEGMPEMLSRLLSPFLHSSYEHLVGNLYLTIIFGWLLEYRTTAFEYLGFIWIVGVAGNVVVPAGLLLAGVGVSFGVGALFRFCDSNSRRALEATTLPFLDRRG